MVRSFCHLHPEKILSSLVQWEAYFEHILQCFSTTRRRVIIINRYRIMIMILLILFNMSIHVQSLSLFGGTLSCSYSAACVGFLHHRQINVCQRNSLSFRIPRQISSGLKKFTSSEVMSSPSDVEMPEESQGIDLSDHPDLYRVRISRRTGIEWGTDLSFAFVYVRQLEPAGSAELTGKIQKGDQICELRPVADDNKISKPINLIGASFDNGAYDAFASIIYLILPCSSNLVVKCVILSLSCIYIRCIKFIVMAAFALLDKSVSDVDLVFFRGTKEELIKACKGDTSSDPSDEICITVNIKSSGSDNARQQIIKAKKGDNVRKVLTDNGINVYQSLTRWTNCKGKQLCGTCIVNIADGSQYTNRKSMDEGSTLRENPESYRLSCVTFAYGDITVDTFPPVNAAQWTR